MDLEETLPHPTTIEEAAERDPIGSRYVELVSQAHGLYGDRAYIVDYPDKDTFDPAVLHPSLPVVPADGRTLAQLLQELTAFDSQIPATGNRNAALHMRLRGLEALLRGVENPVEFSPSEVARIAYGFDPREIPRVTRALRTERVNEMYQALPPDKRPKKVDPLGIQDARALFLNSLRAGVVVDEDEAVRATYFGTAREIIEERAAKLGVVLPDVDFQVRFTSRGGEDFFYLFHPEKPQLTAHLKREPNLYPLPTQTIWLLAHEYGHNIHFRRMFEHAIRDIRTEDAIYSVGPQAVSEGLAEAFPRLLFPDAQSYYDAVRELYRGIKLDVNEDHLRHICNFMYREGLDLTRLALKDKVEWNEYIAHERNAKQHGVAQADAKFVESYQQAFLTNVNFAQRRLQILKFYGPYVFVYAFYRPWVWKQLEGAEDKVAKLLELCDEVPTSVGNMKDYV
ncbi:hypothetical protein A3H80_01265 [Candidatus Roizmanbacteria bacterium RIFCSPLOWO2_02_FULL_37_19]|uniref:Uncharacterized protein n=1 Tax=Candidatus Roizmanbacteria bacterium RIFCSPHIGHO2_02_FULL_37_24 TaxID=1802037 RepID=A0A1F7GUS8_9BACT|nr:MAG: hypothetical protein A2862_00535 [Candidatus Roizmanbacteria bacterium RIFCSPHIGHO2_01_FULL_38_41]OGK22565.1 MAG: hypothetical protein A3C24_05385 [Candidatus Roizmanbacteria bacterium RIFCSPHIGHO2_02_FULL_37_24]OGK32712.1 MAG: hypothetical protein A3E10_00300 [Candidatus Roizmanbacteria bacterium RIFCSPHIGHO2_12_FULL_37_23]OGK54228.1 MAG: hypothetical protein A3H80_01265 [Candidatus Roizmanbacteria bacterium RIFCSPLOWO2_02_FULL_37_19]